MFYLNKKILGCSILHAIAYKCPVVLPVKIMFELCTVSLKFSHISKDVARSYFNSLILICNRIIIIFFLQVGLQEASWVSNSDLAQVSSLRHTLIFTGSSKWRYTSHQRVRLLIALPYVEKSLSADL